MNTKIQLGFVVAGRTQVLTIPYSLVERENQSITITTFAPLSLYRYTHLYVYPHVSEVKKTTILHPTISSSPIGELRIIFQSCSFSFQDSIFTLIKISHFTYNPILVIEVD